MGRYAADGDGSGVGTGADLKAELKRLSKGTMSFAFGLKDAQTPLLILHRNKTARALGTQIKAELGAKQATFGTASGSGVELVLDVEGPRLSGIGKKVKLLLRQEQISLYTKVKVRRGGVEEAAEGDDQAAGTGAPATLAPAPPGASAAAIADAKSAYPPPPIPPGSHPVSAGENQALAAMDADTLRQQDLTQRDPKQLFTDEYMQGLVGKDIPGAKDPDLKDVMRQLAKGASGAKRQKLIADLARIRGVDAGKLDGEYDRFLVLRDQQAAFQKKKKAEGKDIDAVPNLAEDFHGDFMGSNPQLVFGKVVGDAFGVDPVFGALLSPTGGMVGPGNAALHLDDDDPTGYHGIVHDAAGYLRNYHDQGPGYNYLGKESRDTSDPLTGQQSGMRYWHEKLDPGAGTTVMNGVIDVVYVHKDAYDAAKKAYGSASEAASKTVAEIKVESEKALEKARETVEKAIDTAVSTATDKAAQAGTALEQAAQDVSNAASAAATAAEEAVVQTVDSVKQSASDVSAAASEKLNAAWDYVWN